MQVDTVNFRAWQASRRGSCGRSVAGSRETLSWPDSWHRICWYPWPHWISKLKSVGQVPSNQNVDSSLLATNSCFFFAPSPAGCLKGSLPFIFSRVETIFPWKNHFKTKIQGRASSNIFESRVEIFSFRWVLTQNQWSLFEGSDRFRSGKFTDKFRPGKVRGNPEYLLEMPGNSEFIVICPDLCPVPLWVGKRT